MRTYMTIFFVVLLVLSSSIGIAQDFTDDEPDKDSPFAPGKPCFSDGNPENAFDSRAVYHLLARKWVGKGPTGGVSCKDGECDCHFRVKEACPAICELDPKYTIYFPSPAPREGSKSYSGCYLKPPGGYCKIRNKKFKNVLKIPCVFK